MISNEEILNTYDEQEELDHRQQARDKLHVYFDSREEIHHPVREQFNNALDEISTNFKSGEIFVELSDDCRRFTIEDTGRGMPLCITNKNGKPYWQTLFLTLFSGGKYKKDTGKNTSGVNGCGNTVTNYTSKYFEVTSYFRGEEWYISFKDGGRLYTPLTNKGKTDKHGTKISFELDDKVYSVDTIFDFNIIVEYAKKCLTSFPNINMTLKHKDKIVELEGKELKDYFIEETNIKNVLELKEKEILSKYKDTETGEMLPQRDTVKAVFYPSCENLFQQTNLNGIWLRDNGTIYDGIIDGIRQNVNNYCNKEKLFKGKENEIKKEDVEYSVSFVVDFTSSNVEYKGQTKFLTKSNVYKKETKNAIIESLDIIMNENKDDYEKLVKQCLLSMRARIKADVTRKDIIKKLSDLGNTGSKLKIENLNECNFNKSKVEDRILLICEGLSAMSSITDSYDNTYMGCLGLRGRFISSLKKSVSDVLNNIPAYTLIKALGCGIEIPFEERKQFKDIKSFDKSKLRYGNIGILVDSDCFGSGISLSILTFIYKYMPELLKDGRVYVIITPRYEIKLKNGEMKYAYNDREKEEMLKNEIKEEDIAHIGIVKGLGELNSDDFWNKVLCEEARKETFIQVDYNETDEIINKLFEDYMGKDTEPRKEFVRKFITNVNLDEMN